MPDHILDLRTATPERFDPLVGAPLTTPDDLALTLAAVRRLGVSGGPREEPFALELTAPPPVRPQGIVRLHHPDLGTLEVFLVPTGATPDAVTYEAVFN